MVGTKSVTEATDRQQWLPVVGERSHGSEGILRGVLELWEVKMPE
jgi:hypothetical protein